MDPEFIAHVAAEHGISLGNARLPDLVLQELPVSTTALAYTQLTWDQSSSVCAASCCGMPTWRISEPGANLWLTDIPLIYNASHGRSMRFHLYYKNRLGTQGTTDNTAYEIFSVGARWHTLWRSYVQPVNGETTNYWVILGNGTALKMTTNRVDYQRHSATWNTFEAQKPLLKNPSLLTRINNKNRPHYGYREKAREYINSPAGKKLQ